MPLYHVEHICPLVPSQKTQLAQRFTKTHVGIFKGTPSSFVNVRFTYTSPDQDASNNYVGGVARASNRMILNVRPGEARTYDMFVQLITELNQAWTDIVVAGSGESPETVMRATFLNAGIVAAMEAGFMVPKVSDCRWRERERGGEE